MRAPRYPSVRTPLPVPRILPMKPRQLLGLAALIATAASCARDATGSFARDNVPSQVTITSGDVQQATVGTELPQPLVVRVVNNKGKALSGQPVNFVVVGGNGHMLAGTAVTDANGEARDRWTLGTVADSQKVEARAVNSPTGQAIVFATFRAAATPAAPATVAPVGTGMYTALPGAPLPDSVAAVVKDQYGNPVPGAGVMWTVKAGGGSVSPATGTTGPTGVAKAMWTLGGQIDSTQVLEVAAGLTVKSQFTANVKVPLTAQVVIVSGNGQTGRAGEQLAQPLVVRVQYPDGRAIPAVPVTFEIATTRGTVNPVTVVSDTGGRASTQLTLGGTPGLVNVTATIPAPSSAQFTITEKEGAVARLVKISPEGMINPGGAINVKVQAYDAFDNRVSGATISWSASAGQVNPATSQTDSVTSEASTTFTAPVSGTGTGVQVTASSGGAPPVTFNYTVSSTFINITTPEVNGVSGDDLQVLWTATTQPGKTVIRTGAEVEGISASFPGAVVQGPSITRFTANLDISSLTPGTHTVRIWAVSNNGDSVNVTRAFTYTPTPRIDTFTPLDGTVNQNGQVAVAATCSRCISIYIGVDTYGSFYGTTSASGTTAVPNGSTITVTVQAVNAVAGKTVAITQTRRVYVETSGQLSEIASGVGRLYDVDATRVLYTESKTSNTVFESSGPRALRVRPRPGGTATTVDSSFSSWSVAQGSLFTGGLLYNATIVGQPGHVWEWRGSTPQDLGPITAQSLAAAGDWAAWTSGTAVYRRDLGASTTSTIAASSGSDNVSLAENGDLAFVNTALRTMWLHGGTLTQLTSDPDSVGNLLPVTDGVNVLWERGNAAKYFEGGPFAVNAWRGGSESQVAAPHLSPSYAANNGWLAFTRLDAQGVQIWTMAPDGTTRQATSGTGNKKLIALGPAGEVVYELSSRRLAIRAPYTGTAANFAKKWDTSPVRFRGTELQMLLGRSAFSVTF